MCIEFSWVSELARIETQEISEMTGFLDFSDLSESNETRPALRSGCHHAAQYVGSSLNGVTAPFSVINRYMLMVLS